MREGGRRDPRRARAARGADRRGAAEPLRQPRASSASAAGDSMAVGRLWVQLFLALGWTVYVIFLPQLAAQAGLAKEFVPWLLLADQAIFAVMDWTLGATADRVAGVVRRLANAIALASPRFLRRVPAAAVRGAGRLARALRRADGRSGRRPRRRCGRRRWCCWAATCRRLRSRGRRGSTCWAWAWPARWAPYLTVALRDADPRWPFALVRDRAGGGDDRARRAPSARTRRPRCRRRSPTARCAGTPSRCSSFAVALLGLGFQVHFALNSAPGYLRFAAAARTSSA